MYFVEREDGIVFFSLKIENISHLALSLFGSHLISISRTQLSDYSYLHAKIDYNLLSLITFFLWLSCNCGKILLIIQCFPPVSAEELQIFWPEFQIFWVDFSLFSYTYSNVMSCHHLE